MPWSEKDAHKYKKNLTQKQAKKWAKIANSVYEQCQKDNGKNCAEKAIRTANSKVGDSKNEGGDDVSVLEKKIPKKGMYFLEDHTDIQLSVGDDGKESFAMTAYSGKILKNHWLWGDLAIDVQGIQFDKKRNPILEQHDLSRKIGVANSKPNTENNKIEFDKINLLSNEVATEFKQNLDEGFPYQASMGLKPLVIEELSDGQTAEVNGQKMKGPGTIFRKAQFKEASVCVFGFDENTSVSSLSDEDEEICAELIKHETEKNREGESMTLEQLKNDYPDLYKQVQDSFTEKDNKITELSTQVDQLTKERDDLKGETQNLSDSVKDYEKRVAALEKAEALRKASDLKAQASKIIDSKLSEYEIPARLHDKVKKQIDHNEFVDESDNFDTAKFTEKVETEVKDWADTVSALADNSGGVIGFGSGGHEKFNSNEDNSDALVNEMLSYVGVEESKQQ